MGHMVLTIVSQPFWARGFNNSFPVLWVTQLINIGHMGGLCDWWPPLPKNFDLAAMTQTGALYY